MDITSEELESLIEKQQIAHKLIAGFYINTLSAIRDIAFEFDTEFENWEPIENARPGRGSSHPLDKWIWDYLPLYASRYYYRKANMGEKCKKGDFAFHFDLYFDYGFHEIANGYIEPSKMQSGTSLVIVSIYAAQNDAKHSFDVLWDEAPWLVPGERWQDSENGILYGAGEQFELKEVILHPETLKKHIENIIKPT